MSQQKLKKSSEMEKGGLLPGGTSKEYKTGTWKNAVPVLDRKKCTSCFNCASVCPENCIKVKGEKIDHFDMNYCKGCGLCAMECPVGAIRMQKLC